MKLDLITVPNHLTLCHPVCCSLATAAAAVSQEGKRSSTRAAGEWWQTFMCSSPDLLGCQVACMLQHAPASFFLIK
eukprot:1140639-Pelagomonas_calceolata.AAC.2